MKKDRKNELKKLLIQLESEYETLKEEWLSNKITSKEQRIIYLQKQQLGGFISALKDRMKQNKIEF